MKKMISLVLGSVLLLGIAACNGNSDTATTEDNGIRSDQRESDARAREQREGMTGNDGEEQSTEDLAVDVRNSLESNLPGSRLAVDIDDDNGMATIDGTVISQAQFDEIEPIVMAFEGIRSVDVQAEIDSN